MFDTMRNNSDFWTICLSHTLGCAINGVKSKAPLFGIEKNKFDSPDEFVKEARKHRKIPKSAPKGKNLENFGPGFGATVAFRFAPLEINFEFEFRIFFKTEFCESRGVTLS